MFLMLAFIWIRNAQMGVASNHEAPRGKRSYGKDHISIGKGQMRLFGGERDD